MFVDNKYYKTYMNLVTKAKTAGRIKQPNDGFEEHHILPSCMGGRSNKANLVAFTPKEHFVAHRLLMKCTEGKAKMQMACAWFFMSNKRKYNSRGVEAYRLARKKACSGTNCPAYGKKPFFSEEHRRKISEAGKGREFSPEAKEKIRQASLRQWKKRKASGKTTLCEDKEKFGLSISITMGSKPFNVFRKADGSFVGEWISKSHCARDLKLAIPGRISRCLLNRPDAKSYGGYIFRFKDPENNVPLPADEE